MFRVTVLFSEIGRQNQDGHDHGAADARGARGDAARSSRSAGGNSTWDRLAEYLEKESTGKDKFVINRTFDAPIETMFQMWTDPKHFSQWLPPTGFRMEFIRADIRPAGSGFYMMTNNADEDVRPGGVSENSQARPLRLHAAVLRREGEYLSRHPMPPTWPATMLTTVALYVRRSRPDARDRHMGTARPDDGGRARNVHQCEGRDDARLDRIVRQVGGAPGEGMMFAFRRRRRHSCGWKLIALAFFLRGRHLIRAGRLRLRQLFGLLTRRARGPTVSGSLGKEALAVWKRNAAVRSPKVLRRQSVMFGSRTPVNFSQKLQDRGVVERLAAHPAAGGPGRDDDARHAEPAADRLAVDEFVRRACGRRGRRDVVEDAVVLVVIENERRLGPDLRGWPRWRRSCWRQTRRRRRACESGCSDAIAAA